MPFDWKNLIHPNPYSKSTGRVFLPREEILNRINQTKKDNEYAYFWQLFYNYSIDVHDDQGYVSFIYLELKNKESGLPMLLYDFKIYSNSRGKPILEFKADRTLFLSIGALFMTIIGWAVLTSLLGNGISGYFIIVGFICQWLLMQFLVYESNRIRIKHLRYFLNRHFFE